MANKNDLVCAGHECKNVIDLEVCPICKETVCPDHSEYLSDREVTVCIGCISKWLDSMGVQ